MGTDPIFRIVKNRVCPYFFVLLALPALAQECRVLDPELQGSYTGPCVNGLAEGRGAASGLATYEGEFRAGLDTLLDLPIVAEIRGMGYFYGIELTNDGVDFTDDECEWLIRGFLSTRLLANGLTCRADDRGDPVIQLSPPLIAGPEDAFAASEPVRVSSWCRRRSRSASACCRPASLRSCFAGVMGQT